MCVGVSRSESIEGMLSSPGCPEATPTTDQEMNYKIHALDNVLNDFHSGIIPLRISSSKQQITKHLNH
jgi:hypothetical protein